MKKKRVREKTYESQSVVSLFSCANTMVAEGWTAWRFSTRTEGWLCRRTVYSITFRKRLPPSRPGAINIRTTAEEEAMLQFVVVLPAKTPEEHDVVSRRVTLRVGGLELEPQVVPVDTLEIGPFNGQQGADVFLRVWNVDDAGNLSETSTDLTATLVDTFAPPAPGEIALRTVGETSDAPPEPTPGPTPVIDG